jgi:putative ABC transport system permease protein
MNLASIVWDGLRRRKIRTTLSVLGIAIATTALFTLVSLREGYETGMRAELESMGAQVVAVAKGCPYEALAVLMIGGQVPATLPAEVVEQIRLVPNVASASPNVFGAYKYLGLSHPLIGITPHELQLKRWWKIKGRFPEADSEVVLGSVEAAVYAEKSSDYKQIGDSLNVEVGGRKFGLKVVGILETTGSKDDYATFTTLETAQRLMNFEGRVVSVNIRVKDINRIAEAMDDIHAIPDVQAVTVTQVLGTIQNLVKTGQTMLLVVMMIALVIGGLGTMNTMMMTIFERTREIGLMKAIGASRGQVFRLFLSEGMGICLAGSLIGVAAGTIATLMGDTILKQFVSIMPTVSVGRIYWQAAVLAIVVPLAVGVVSALYPALRAARLDPIQALRNE